MSEIRSFVYESDTIDHTVAESQSLNLGIQITMYMYIH